MSTQPKILVFAGSTREESLNRKLAKAAVEALREVGAEANLIELRDYPMPLYDGDFEAAQGLPPQTVALKAEMARYDGFAIASPEYNGSFPAVVKNTIDWLTRPLPGERPTSLFRGKVAGLLTTSPSPRGGERGLKHLLELLEMIGTFVVPAQVAVPKGDLDSPEVRVAIRGLAQELVRTVRERQAA